MKLSAELLSLAERVAAFRASDGDLWEELDVIEDRLRALAGGDQVEAPPTLELTEWRAPCIAEVERQWRVTWSIDQFACDGAQAVAQAFVRMQQPIDLNDPEAPAVFQVAEVIDGEVQPAMTLDLAASAGDFEADPARYDAEAALMKPHGDALNDCDSEGGEHD